MKVFQCDLDGVLFHNVGMIIKLSDMLYSMTILPEDITSFGMQEIFTREQVEEIIHHPDYISKQTPNEGATLLSSTLMSRGWSFHIATARPESQREGTVALLTEHGIPYSRLAMSVASKGDYAESVGAFAAVDDNLDNVNDLAYWVKKAYLYRPPHIFYNQGEVDRKTKVVKGLYDILSDLWLEN